MKQIITNSRVLIKLWMFVWFVYYCLKLRVDPWRFFQLNADYFNKEKGIYSKLEINQLIPYRWRLRQLVYDEQLNPGRYPVFLKPEWGQNSYGIYRADSPQSLKDANGKIAQKDLTYLLQEAASETREFEIYYIRQALKPDVCAVLTVTEVKNSGENAHPINGVNNNHTTYTDLTQGFSGVGERIIWNHVRQIGNFRMARVCVKANSEADLLKGRFHIVEINLYTPMPINLLDPDISWRQKARFIENGMWFLAENARNLSDSQEHKSVFFRKLAMHYKVKS
jgi:hypothetical protein